MALEINGTNVVIANGTGTIVGQMEATLTFGGTPIDMSNKSGNDNVEYIDGELASKQAVFSGSIVYNDDAQYRKVRADALAGTMDTYTITYAGSGATTDEVFSALFMPNGMSDSLPMGDKVSTAITFSSSGVVTHTPAA